MRARVHEYKRLALAHQWREGGAGWHPHQWRRRRSQKGGRARGSLRHEAEEHQAPTWNCRLQYCSASATRFDLDIRGVWFLEFIITVTLSFRFDVLIKKFRSRWPRGPRRLSFDLEGQRLDLTHTDDASKPLLVQREITRSGLWTQRRRVSCGARGCGCGATAYGMMLTALLAKPEAAALYTRPQPSPDPHASPAIWFPSAVITCTDLHGPSIACPRGSLGIQLRLRLGRWPHCACAVRSARLRRVRGRGIRSPLGR